MQCYFCKLETANIICKRKKITLYYIKNLCIKLRYKIFKKLAKGCKNIIMKRLNISKIFNVLFSSIIISNIC